MLPRNPGLVELRPCLRPQNFLVTHSCRTLVAALQALVSSIPLFWENGLIGVRASPHVLWCRGSCLRKWHGLAEHHPRYVLWPLEGFLSSLEGSLRVPEHRRLTVLAAVAHHVVVENFSLLRELPVLILPGG